jgi:hypothetical protein
VATPVIAREPPRANRARQKENAAFTTAKGADMNSVKAAIEIKINPVIAAELRCYARFRNVATTSVMTDAVTAVLAVLEEMEILNGIPSYTDAYLQELMHTDKPFQRWKKNRRASIVPVPLKKTGKAAKKPTSFASQR